MKVQTLVLIAIAPVVLAVGCGNRQQKEKSQTKAPDTIIQKSVERVISIGGTYRFGADMMKGPVGSLKIYPISESVALFYLDVNRGAPSYNMAMLAGEMKRTDGIWLYGAGDGKSTCTLKFSFDNSQVKVELISGQETCGFGAGVNVAETYKITDRNTPIFFINGEGDTVKFESLKSGQPR